MDQISTFQLVQDLFNHSSLNLQLDEWYMKKQNKKQFNFMVFRSVILFVIQVCRIVHPIILSFFKFFGGNRSTYQFIIAGIYVVFYLLLLHVYLAISNFQFYYQVYLHLRFIFAGQDYEILEIFFFYQICLLVKMQITIFIMSFTLRRNLFYVLMKTKMLQISHYKISIGLQPLLKTSLIKVSRLQRDLVVEVFGLTIA
eukprot:TRINITY_DN23357_c0_g1_i1.p1 TRINITY_DN23357_c0_g1~~TRINITY_DN23357_c0_g1_i1.p1  ORF type:complete len:199 (-),score=-11.41 TRINITY_DN23357_c0_g1_i1:5-601(-)